MAFGTRLEQAWYSAAPWLCLLRPLEWLFRAVSGLRRWLYARGLLSSYRPGVPVVVVGNITVGGTGKTPIVISLVEALKAAGHRPGVVSRGYGAEGGDYPRLLDANSDAAAVGDEPLLIYRRTGAPVVVDPRRGRAARYLEHQCDVDIVISDDGLQHYALQRDFEIAVLDDKRRIGNGFCLPAGPLREPESRLGSVDWVLYRGGPGRLNSVRYEADDLVDLVSGETRGFNPQAGEDSVHAVAGIGQPGQFFESLRAAGFSLTEHIFPDHHYYTAAELQALTDGPVIMTEKDAVKCRGLLAPVDAGRFWYLRIEARLPPALIDAIKALATGPA